MPAVRLAPVAAFAISVSASAGVTTYLCIEDSPFDIPMLFVEDFEDGFEAPGVTASAGTDIGPGGLTDSVDCDDRTIDGSGTSGRSFFSGSGTTGITLTFDADELGGWPTHAGVVWTDGAPNVTVTFQAWDPDRVEVANLSAPDVGDIDNVGGTDEDCFFGVSNPGGVAAIKISHTGGGVEIDHLQYGPVELTTCPADFDSDGSVGTSDLLILLAAWGNCPAGQPCNADLNGSEDVGTSDLLEPLSAWGGC